MSDPVIRRLNVIIGLLLVVIALQTFPFLSQLLFIVVLVGTLLLAGALVWGLSRPYS